PGYSGRQHRFWIQELLHGLVLRLDRALRRRRSRRTAGGNLGPFFENLVGGVKRDCGNGQRRVHSKGCWDDRAVRDIQAAVEPTALLEDSSPLVNYAIGGALRHRASAERMRGQHDGIIAEERAQEPVSSARGQELRREAIERVADTPVHAVLVI